MTSLVIKTLLTTTAILGDVMLIPGALGLLALSFLKINFNPSEAAVIKNKPAILLLHGSGFNDIEWIIGRQFISKTAYGAIFSMNYDGLICNDNSLGIEDYAGGKVRREIQRITQLTDHKEIIIIGHSMGGLIAGYYAEHFSSLDGIMANHVISIATPWHGSPIINFSWKVSKNLLHQTKKHRQMSTVGGTEENPTFRQDLITRCIDSEKQGIRKYYSIWSIGDFVVPDFNGRLNELSDRTASFDHLGHYAIVVWPGVWAKINDWLREIYS